MITDHRSSIKTRKKTSIAVHFNLPGHSIRDLKIVVVEHLTADSKTERKGKERFWMSKLGTKFPLGINYTPY